MKRPGLYAAALLIMAISLFPFYYTFVTSFASDQGQFEVAFWPRRLNLSNYGQVLGQPIFPTSLVNSAVVAVLTVAASLALAVMAAYALGRVRFAGRGLLLASVLAVSMFPQVAVLAGMFEMVRFFHLYNTIGSMILAQTAFTLPFSVWLLTTFMRALPVEVEEAAVIDGATPFAVVTRIFLPLLALRL